MGSNSAKNMIFGSFGVAGLVALGCLLDMVTGIPFARQMTFDILFLLAAGVVAYLAWDAYKDMA
jgi:hypothetical protein